MPVRRPIEGRGVVSISEMALPAEDDDPDAPRTAEVIEALTAILGSRSFAAAPRSRDFLAYIVTEQIAGRGGLISEHKVARHALGRPEYDARLNSSVRVQASRLRTLLERYYATEGADATVRICLPTGSYLPTMTRRQPERPTLSVADEAVVAVLRFDATGIGAPLIATTVCDAIVDHLADFSGLQVVGPAAVTTDEPGVASHLFGARFILRGTVTVTETAVGLGAALTDASSGEVVWTVAECLSAEEFDGLQLEDRWAAAIAGQIGDSTGIIFRRDLARDQEVDSAVYAARLAYTDYLMKGTSEAVASAADALDLALAAGPRPDLLAMRGAVHNAEANQGAAGSSREWELSRAETLALQALELDPQNAAAHLVLGGTAWQRQDWRQAHEHAARAVRLAPCQPTVLMSAGTIIAVSGDWDTGSQVMRKGFRLNPLHAGYAHAVPALTCLIAGDDAGALAEASMVHAPGQLWGPLYRALALAGLGYLDQAWTEMSQVLEIEPGFLDDPANYFTSGARLSAEQLATLMAHFEPFAIGQPI